MSGLPVTVEAPAKVNLFLHLTGRRADGYHLIDSVFVFTEFGDRLTVAPADRLELTARGPQAAALGDVGDDNIVLRAARMLAREAGVEPRVRIALDKNIPVAAGLGGGSADAAAALIALDRLWRLDTPRARLAALALDLGADVPACLAGRPCHVRGIGEVLDPLAGVPGWGVLLVNPRRAVPTPQVFRAFREAGRAFRPPLDGVAGWQEIDWLAAATGNDLEAPALGIEPEIGEVVTTLGVLPGCRLARMSGSGASCFALFDDRATARQAQALLERVHPAWWSAATGLREVAASGVAETVNLS